MVTNEVAGSRRASGTTVREWRDPQKLELAILVAHKIGSAGNRPSNQKRASLFSVPVNEAW
jgi:hypothetical protein